MNRLPRAHSFRSITFLALLLLLLGPGVETLSAQPYRDWVDTTLVEERLPFGIEPGQFPIGIYFYFYNGQQPIDDIWKECDSTLLDFALVKTVAGHDSLRALLDASIRPADGKVIPMPAFPGSYLSQAGRGQEIVFYPFDSSQMRAATDRSLYYFDHQFMAFDDDETAFNQEYLTGFGKFANRESIYQLTDAGKTVASGIAYRVNPAHTFRFPEVFESGAWRSVGSDSIANTHMLLEQRRASGATYYLVLTGHLFEGGTADDEDNLFRIDVLYETPKGKKYRDGNDDLQTAGANLRRTYRSFFVTKEDLEPENPNNPIWDAYVSVTFPLDLDSCAGCTFDGPLSSGNESLNFDIEVVYLGNEKVALRSVAIRDSIVQLLMGTGQESADYRDSVIVELERMALTPGTDTIHPGIFAMYADGELEETQYGGFTQIQRLAKENFQRGGDSLGLFAEWSRPWIHHLGNSDWVVPEYYFNVGVIPKQDIDFTLAFEIPYQQTPSVAQHNGGRYGIPLLFDFDSLSEPGYRDLLPGRIDDYEETIQTQYFGRYEPSYEQTWPHNGTRVHQMGNQAEVTRDEGLRLLSALGPTSWLKVYMPDAYPWLEDTLVMLSHRYEMAELRLLGNLTLTYGSKGWMYYEHQTHDMMHPLPENIDTLFVESCCMGYGGRHVFDTNRSKNILDWAVRWSGYPDPDTLLLIEDMYLGLRKTPIEITAMNAWAKRLESTLTRLRWRDAYSIHWQTRRPSKDASNTPRVLPSDEIISDVTARHPVTGSVDSAWRTYVEVGLFETLIDTTGGVRNRQLDSNFIFLTNRRVFETGNYDTADIAYPDSVRALLDTLSGTRTISVRFNLGHPDSTQYSFIRVREVEPDNTIPLPLIGIRSGLDTIIYGDSAIEITLGAGRAALLEVTYAKPDTSIVDGHLHWNNQRKMIYFNDDRYHTTYLRNDTIFYRRSMAMGPDPASIHWEPIEQALSKDFWRTTTQNWTPSITGWINGVDTVISVVWTCHSDSSGVRDVMVHDVLLSYSSPPQPQGMEHVDWHDGTDSIVYGDAVIASMHGGDVIAWGDSTLGVVSRIRLRDRPWNPLAFSNRILVSQPYHDTANGHIGRWPSLPAFAHRASLDSNVAIVWNQPVGATGANRHIYYQRILQLPAAGGVPGDSLLNFTPVTWIQKPVGRPSIDQTQDVWHRLQEGIVWVEDVPGPTKSRIWYRSMWTEVVESLDGDTIKSTQAWSSASIAGPRLGQDGDSWPTTASINDKSIITDTANDAHFSIAWIDRGDFGTDLLLKQAEMQYAMDTFRLEWPKDYVYDGDQPQGCASPLPQRARHAILYEAPLGGSSTRLRTSRQFFSAKSRPTGYVAKGRRTIVPIDRQSGTYFELLAHDPWIADDATGTALSWIPRDPSKKIDSVHQVEELLRTRYFTAGDSTAIGLELQAFFLGDSAEAPTARISLIAELVDSTNGVVIEQLDSIAVTAAADSHHVVLDPVYDLLSSTYYIRVRLDTVDLDAASSEANQEIFHVSEYASMVPEPPSAKLARHLGPSSGNGLRISAQPNPADDRVEIRFSVSETTDVSVVMIDGLGREVSRPLATVEYASGRYSIELGTDNLPPGSYIVELRAGRERATTRLVVR